MPKSANPFRSYYDAGFRRLVPIVPPDAELSPLSNLAKRPSSRGKAVGYRGNDGLWRGFDWVRAPAPTLEQLDVWQEMGAGVGIRTGQGIYALDIDILDWKIAGRLQEIFTDKLGPAPIRIGKPPKLLMLYKAEHELPYVRLDFPAGQRIELLGEGRQFVTEGIHPETRKPYDWRDGEPHVDNLSTIVAGQLASRL